MFRALASSTLCISLVAGGMSPALADEPKYAGGTFISVQDTTNSTCIDASKDLVSVTLANVQIQRSKSWFDSLTKEDTALGVKFDVTLVDSSGKDFNFPRAARVSAQKSGADIATLPIILPIMSKYNLTANGEAFVSARFDISFITVEDKSAEFKAFDTLIKFSSKLPLPPNPYVQGVGYFGDFANMIVDQNIKKGVADNPDAVFGGDIAAEATQAAACPKGALRTGIQAALFDYQGDAGAGANIVKVSNSANYCYWLQGSFLVFDPRSGICATSAPAAAKRLQNPMVVFLVNAWPKLGGAKGSGKDLAAGLSASGPQLVTSQAKVLIADAKGEPTEKALLADQIAKLSEAVSGSHKTTSAESAKRISDATEQEASAVVAARRCAVVGIPLSDCF